MAYSGANPAEGIPSTGNSSIVNLAANGIFTGVAEDVTIYSSIKINVFSSHISALNGLSYQQSHDGIFWPPVTDVYTIPANTQKSFAIAVNMRFFRLLYTNGATLTTQLIIQVLYNKSDKQPSSVRPQDGRANDNDFVEVISAMIGYNSVTDAWNRVGITNATSGGNENIFDRLKVNASLRMIDNAQPSGSKLVGVTGTQALGMDVNIKNTSLAVTGPATDAQLRLTPLPVSMSNTLALTDTQIRATPLAVSGPFFPATQPVSLATNTPDVTDRAARLLGIVSVRNLTIASQASSFGAGASGATTGFDVSSAANVTFIIKNSTPATPWTGTPVFTFEQSDDNVSWGLLSVVRNDTGLAASTHTLPANTANNEYLFDSAIENNSFVRLRVITGSVANGITIIVQPGSLPFSPSVTSILNPETTKVIGTVNIAAVTATAKGTQGASFLPTQDAKDAGRNQVHYYTVIPVLTSATDTLQTLTGTKGGATVVATATPAVVTTAKILRITRVSATYIATAASGYGIVRLRFNTAGVAAITSPIAATLVVGSGAPTTANSTASVEASIAEGWEFAAATGIGISVQGFAAVTATAVGYVLVSVTGYEY